MFDDVSQDGIDLTFLGAKERAVNVCIIHNMFSFALLSHCEVSAGELHPDFSTVDVILKKKKLKSDVYYQ